MTGNNHDIQRDDRRCGHCERQSGECAVRCRDCDGWLCGDCAGTETVECGCGNTVCDDCARTCNECGSRMCGDCTYCCEHCEHSLCEDCGYRCRMCDDRLCSDCQEYCEQCDERYCPYCYERHACANTQDPCYRGPVRGAARPRAVHLRTGNRSGRQPRHRHAQEPQAHRRLVPGRQPPPRRLPRIPERTHDHEPTHGNPPTRRTHRHRHRQHAVGRAHAHQPHRPADPGPLVLGAGSARRDPMRGAEHAPHDRHPLVRAHPRRLLRQGPPPSTTRTATPSNSERSARGTTTPPEARRRVHYMHAMWRFFQKFPVPKLKTRDIRAMSRVAATQAINDTNATTAGRRRI